MRRVVSRCYARGGGSRGVGALPPILFGVKFCFDWVLSGYFVQSLISERLQIVLDFWVNVAWFDVFRARHGRVAACRLVFALDGSSSIVAGGWG